MLWEYFRGRTDQESRDEAQRLAGELLAHWRGKAEDCDREHRFLAGVAALREAIRFDESPETEQRLRTAEARRTRLFDDWREALHQISLNRREEAIRILNGIIREKPNDNRAHGKLGMLYALAGRTELAVEHLEAVAQHDRDDGYGETMLGWLAYLDGRSTEALEHFRRADEIEPYNARIQWQTGLVLVQMDRAQEAVKSFQKALEIDPRHLESCLALSASLRTLGRADEALPVAVRAVQVAGRSHLDATINLAECYAALDRYDAASAEIGRAIESARVQSPSRSPTFAQDRPVTGCNFPPHQPMPIDSTAFRFRPAQLSWEEARQMLKSPAPLLRQPGQTYCGFSKSTCAGVDQRPSLSVRACASASRKRFWKSDRNGNRVSARENPCSISSSLKSLSPTQTNARARPYRSIRCRSNSSCTMRPSTAFRVYSEASSPHGSAGRPGCLVSGVSTPINRTRWPVSNRSVSPSTTRATRYSPASSSGAMRCAPRRWRASKRAASTRRIQRTRRRVARLGDVRAWAWTGPVRRVNSG